MSTPAGPHTIDGASTRSLDRMEAIRTVPAAVARRHRLVPLGRRGATLRAAAVRPDEPRAREALRRLGFDEVEWSSLGESEIGSLIDSWYGASATLLTLAEDLARSPLRAEDPSLGTDGDPRHAPASLFVAAMLEAALAEGASDVHLEPGHAAPRLRFRVDGVLRDRPAPPAWLAPRVLARVKALCGMDLGECRFAQDGQMTFGDGADPLHLRISVLPADGGECAVLRLLPGDGKRTGMNGVGVREDDRLVLEGALGETGGLIVLAGPTGSGKTTTLHALLDGVDLEARNVVSIEEPIEIRHPGIRQIPVQRETGMDFAGALRAVLRQDPDVILVGETRDRETASLALQAALTGHLVLTTVHATSAALAVDRLDHLGVDRATLAETLRLVVAQRLVRRLCPSCRGEACFLCDGTGHRGRTGLFELLPVTGRTAALLRAGAASSEVLEAAREAGLRTLADEGARLADEGITSAGEVARVLGGAAGAALSPRGGVQ